MTANQKHVGLYARISQDKSGRAEGVEEQVRWGREYAGATWPDLPVVVYSENNISGGDDDRPELTRMRQAITAGECVQVVTTYQSRLTRTEVWFQMATEMAAAGVLKFHTRHDGIMDVLGLLAGIMAVINAWELRLMKEKLMDRLDANARKGQPPGSRPFGYRHAKNDDGDKTYEIVPEQAEAIRLAARMVMEGRSLTEVAAKLRSQGVAGPHRVKVRDAQGNVVLGADGEVATRPSTITPGGVRKFLMSPSIAGIRTHRGEQSEQPGNWPAIISPDEWRVLRARLANPRTVRRRDGKDYVIGPSHRGTPGRPVIPRRQYLLTSGLAVCGSCGGPLIGTMKQLRNKQGISKHVPYLTCKPRGEGGDYIKVEDRRAEGKCVSIMMTEVDAYVLYVMWATIDTPGFRERVKADPHSERRAQIGVELEALDARRSELSALVGSGAILMSEWQEMKKANEDARATKEAELRSIPPPPSDVDIEAVRRDWQYLDLAVRRAFIRRWVRKVTIKPAKPGTMGFDENRVDVDLV